MDNAYDSIAEDWADRQKKGKSLGHYFLEKPAMHENLPDLQGKSVLCLGCGSGEECGYFLKQGAVKVVGVDSSRGLIEKARLSYPEAEFFHKDMRSLDLPGFHFDFVYSSLAMHYIEDWREVFSGVHRVLKAGGMLLFSTHHPVKWGALVAKSSKGVEVLMGYRRTNEGQEIMGDYLNERKIVENIRKDLRIEHFHKPISVMVKSIVSSGFEIMALLEPQPIESAKIENLGFYEAHKKIPLFIIFKLRKK